MTDDFFRSRLDQMIDNSHPLAVLASRLPWEKMQAGVAPQFVHQVHPLKQSEEAPDLAGPVVKVSVGKASNAGRPRLSTRLMISLTLLKNSFDLSHGSETLNFDSLTQVLRLRFETALLNFNHVVWDFKQPLKSPMNNEPICIMKKIEVALERASAAAN